MSPSPSEASGASHQTGRIADTWNFDESILFNNGFTRPGAGSHMQSKEVENKSVAERLMSPVVFDFLQYYLIQADVGSPEESVILRVLAEEGITTVSTFLAALQHKTMSLNKVNLR